MTEELRSAITYDVRELEYSGAWNGAKKFNQDLADLAKENGIPLKEVQAVAGPELKKARARHPWVKLFLSLTFY